MSRKDCKAKTRVSPSDSLAADPSTVTANSTLRDSHKVGTQVEHGSGCGEMLAELSAIAAAGRYIADWCSAGQPAEPKG